MMMPRFPRFFVFSLFSLFCSALLTFAGLSLPSCSSTPSMDKKEAAEKSQIYYNHGTEHLVAKNYPEALDLLLKANELDPKSSDIHNNLGMAYYFRGDDKKALEHLNFAIKYNEKNADARNNLASLYFNLGNYTLASQHYQQILKDLTYKHQYRVYYNLSLISIKNNNYEQAKKLLAKSIHENKDYCPAHLELGKIERKFYQFQKAHQHLLNSIRGACYNLPAPHYTLGQNFLDMNETFKAEQKFKEISERFPQSEYAKLALGSLRDLKNQRLYSNDETPQTAPPISNLTKNISNKDINANANANENERDDQSEQNDDDNDNDNDE